MNDLKITSNLDKNIMKQLYVLLDDFHNEVKSKNKDLVVLDNKVNIFKKVLNNIKENNERTVQKKIADEIFKGKMKDSKMFCVLDKEKLIGFEMAQVQNIKDKNKIIGWKPWLYIEPEYRMKCSRINDSLNNKEESITRALDNEVEKWFLESKVTHQKTATGKNMTKNIVAYIREGFVIYSKDNKNVYMEKDINNPIKQDMKKKMFREIKSGVIQTYSLDKLIQNKDNNDFNRNLNLQTLDNDAIINNIAKAKSEHEKIDKDNICR